MELAKDGWVWQKRDDEKPLEVMPIQAELYAKLLSKVMPIILGK